MAGFARPDGFRTEKKARNTAGDFVFGACPDFNEPTAELFESDDIKSLLRSTERNDIVFWNIHKVKNRPSLDPEVIGEARSIMALSIQQALAGPWEPAAKWEGRPVFQLVRLIYCDHLNERNRAVARRRKREVALGGNLERQT